MQLAGTNRVLRSTTVTMSTWAKHSEYLSMSGAGWTHPITFNVYNVNNAGSVPALGALIKSVTQTVDIPWRPEADATCPGTAWRASDTQCYNGLAFNVTFDLSSPSVTLPNDVIVGIAYNTQTYGSTPMGVPGPYNSLNVGAPKNGAATVGTDVNTDNVFWNTSHAPFYADGGAAGVGIFRHDTNWTPNGTVAIKITASPTLVGPPTSKDQCLKSGWVAFNNPSFNSQGDCVSFVSTGGKNTAGS